jgi:hypothetical protein
LQPTLTPGQSLQDIFNFVPSYLWLNVFLLSRNSCPLPGLELPVFACSSMRGLYSRPDGPLTLWPRGTCREQGECCSSRSETTIYLKARSPLGRDAALLRGFGVAVIREPWFWLRVMSIVPRGLAPLGARCRMVAWIRDNSSSGAPVPGMGECQSFPPRGLTSMWKRDRAWLNGFRRQKLRLAGS